MNDVNNNADYIGHINTKYVIFNDEMNIATSPVRYLGVGDGRWIETRLYPFENNLFEISIYLNLLNEKIIKSLIEGIFVNKEKKESIEMDLYLEYSKINPSKFTLETCNEVVKAKVASMEIESSNEGNSYIINLQFSI